MASKGYSSLAQHNTKIPSKGTTSGIENNKDENESDVYQSIGNVQKLRETGSYDNEKSTNTTLEISNMELQATVESQEELINRMAEDLRNVQRERDFTTEVEILGRDQQCMDLKEEIQGKDMTISYLKTELVVSQNNIEEIFKKYER